MRTPHRPLVGSLHECLNEIRTAGCTLKNMVAQAFIGTPQPSIIRSRKIDDPRRFRNTGRYRRKVCVSCHLRSGHWTRFGSEAEVWCHDSRKISLPCRCFHQNAHSTCSRGFRHRSRRTRARRAMHADQRTARAAHEVHQRVIACTACTDSGCPERQQAAAAAATPRIFENL